MLLTSAEETESLGCRLASDWPSGTVVCLVGDLGVGKTTFVKGVARAFGIEPSEVSSPTFSILHSYEGRRVLHHFDLYRVSNAEDFVAMGFDEMLFSDEITVLEWPQRIEGILPENALWITFTHHEGGRQVEIHR